MSDPTPVQRSAHTVRVVDATGTTIHKFDDAVQYAVIAQCADGKVYVAGRVLNPDAGRDLMNIGMDELWLKTKVRSIVGEMQRGVVAASGADVDNIVGRIGGNGGARP